MNISLLKETAIYGLGAILPRVINLVFVRLFTNELGQSGFSKFADIYSIIAVLLVISTFGMETAFFRYLTDYGKKKAFASAYLWHILMAGCIAFIVLFFAEDLAAFISYKNNQEYILLLGFTVIFDLLSALPYAYLRANNQAKKFSMLKIFNILIYALSVVLFIVIFPKYNLNLFALNKLGCILLATFLATLTTYFLLLKIPIQNKLAFDLELTKKMLKYGAPIMVAGLSYTLIENFDKMYLKRTIEENLSGAYAGCYKIAVFMILYTTAFRMGIEPYFFKKSKDANAKENYAQILNGYVFLGAIMLTGIVANLDWIKHILIKDINFFVALDIVPIVLFAMLFSGVYLNLSVWYKVTDKTHYGMVFSMIGAILTILIIYFGVPKIGYMAGAWATLVAYLSMCSLSFFFGRLRYKVPYDVKKTIFTFVLTALALLLFQQLKEVWNKNIILIVYLLVLFLINKSTIRKILRNE